MKVFQKEIAAMGYKFQFITLAGFHNLNYSTFKLAEAYKENGMAAYSELQQKEFGAEKDGYSATKYQREVGVSYFDAVSNACLLYTSPSPRDGLLSRMPSSA